MLDCLSVQVIVLALMWPAVMRCRLTFGNACLLQSELMDSADHAAPHTFQVLHAESQSYPSFCDSHPSPLDDNVGTMQIKTHTWTPTFEAMTYYPTSLLQ